MERLEAVELNSKNFRLDNFDFRIDSEYFLKSNLSFIREIDNIGFKRIGEFSYVTDGIHTSIDYSETSNINLISATSPRENYFDISRKAYITEEAHFNNPRTALKENDIIISTVGTIGNCAVVTKNILPANSDRHVGIVRVNKDFLPNYVSTFLVTKYGRFQTWRESTGNVQLNLFLYKIRTLKIANLTNIFQVEIDKVVKLAHAKREFSKQTYKNAETLLLEALGLTNFEPSAEPVNVKGFKESFLTTGRLDAEYYQKKYDVLEKHLDSYERKRIGDFIKYPVSSGVTPKAGGDDYTDSESGIPFVRAVDLQNGEVSTDNFIFIKPEIHNGILKRTQLKKGDVLFSIAGTVGRCALFNHLFEANINQAVSILRFDDNIIKRLYLIVFFNSVIGKEFVSKYSRQGLQTNLNLAEVADLRIPVIDYSIQEQITGLVEESFNLKKQSEQLLETAKRAVEIAIEQDEAAALQFIEEAQRDLM